MPARGLLVAVLSFGLLGLPGGAVAQETVATLTLDGLSFISFGDREVLPIPSGSTLRFRLGTPTADGDIPFTLSPSDVSIPPIAVASEGGTLEYTLAGPASGWVRKTADGRKVEFSASVISTLSTPTGGGALSYSVPFTTESLVSRNLAGDRTIPVTGQRLVEGAWYVQLVGATPNKADARPEPGSAVYTVLSGRFDQIP